MSGPKNVNVCKKILMAPRKISSCALPKFAVAFARVLTSVLSKKLSDRVTFSSHQEHLEKDFDMKILPSELGGVESTKAMLDDFKVLAEKHKEKVQLIMRQSIDLSFLKDHNDDQVESFRTIEFD